jgi:tight adherence protein C
MEFLLDRQVLIMLLTAIAAAATVLTIGMQLVPGDNLGRRMKNVAIERERIRAREREKLGKAIRGNLRNETSTGIIKDIVDRFSLAKYFGREGIPEQLAMAGLRGQRPVIMYLFFRFLMPILMFLLALIYIFIIFKPDWSPVMKLAACIIAAAIGLKLPEVYIKNKVNKRQLSVRRAFPDAMDLLLICAESGMSIEAAFRKVGDEIGPQSLELAEELTLTTAEMSYLQDRRMAFENLGNRTGLESVKAVCSALIQAEKYGTPVGQALRVLAQESRDMRMMEAEKKAASLPPKLTVPMILFFLPVLFVIIMGPAAMQIMAL